MPQRRQLFIRTNDETLSVIAMRVSNADCAPVWNLRLTRSPEPFGGPRQKRPFRLITFHPIMFTCGAASLSSFAKLPTPSGLEIDATLHSHAASDDCFREQFAALPGRTETNRGRCSHFHFHSHLLGCRRALAHHANSTRDACSLTPILVQSERRLLLLAESWYEGCW